MDRVGGFRQPSKSKWGAGIYVC